MKTTHATLAQTTQLVLFSTCGSLSTRKHIGWACLDHNEDGVQVVLNPLRSVRDLLWATNRYEWVRMLAVDEHGNFWVVA